MPLAFESGARVETLNRIDSTSAEATRRISVGERGPLWLIAIEQYGGYGRRGTPWVHGPGDLAATYIFEARDFNGGAPLKDLARQSQLSFVAAVALHEALKRYAPQGDFTLKWPNDALLDGRKISGILLELKDVPNGFVLCLGLGVNLINAPCPDGRQTARLSKKSSGKAPQPAEFLRVYDEVFTVWQNEWNRSGFAPVRDAWLARAYGVGRDVILDIPDEKETARSITGKFLGIDMTGALILKVDGEEKVFSAGSLFFDKQ
ncbi:MAG: biotin--[acetyl-CoA-carboxylase] ligase [Pseudomonadota bacterium]